MISAAAAIWGLIVGFFLGAIAVSSSYGYELTFVDGVVLTVLAVIWLVVTAFAIAGEESDSL